MVAWADIVQTLYTYFVAFYNNMWYVVSWIMKPIPVNLIWSPVVHSIAGIFGFSLPDIGFEISIFGLMVGVGLPIYIIVQLWKWLKSIII